MKKINLSKNQIILIIAIVLAVVLIAIGVYFFIQYQHDDLPDRPQGEQSDVVAQSDPDCLYARKLDGVCVEEGEESLPVFAFMIENAYDSRPPANLSDASLVYEAIAEGGITRFVAIYDSGLDVERVGPIRSARTYFLEWAQEFESFYMHCGGSPEALELALTRPITDVNEFAYGSYFWRDTRRVAPHNVYTSFSSINKLIEDQEFDAGQEFESWLYKDDLTQEERPQEQSVSVDWNSYYYNVRWDYDPQENNYIRVLGGVMHRDEDGTVITAKNVAVMYTTSYVIAGDDKFRRFNQTTGEGEAIVFLDGQAIVGTWQRETLDDRTRFYDENGNEIKFNRGNTWVEVLPTDYPKVQY